MKRQKVRGTMKQLAAACAAAVLGTMSMICPVYAQEYQEDVTNAYRSELTNEWIDASLQNQRPVAIVVDNELTALPHFGLNQADVVYELMNSTANGRITRLMAIVKDWQSITQFGNIRSARPTNFMLAAEWDSILCHDGGPFYIDEYVARDYTDNLSGGFARFPNGKASEFTEYITYDSYTNETTGKAYAGLGERIAGAGYRTQYDAARFEGTYPGRHFLFSDEELDLTGQADARPAADVILPFPHNRTELHYNAETGCYEYYEYGEPHTDELEPGVTTSFKNVLLQCCDYTLQDQNGYMIYHVVGSMDKGYYLTNGQAVPVSWSKDTESAVTRFYDTQSGEERTLNTGRTYIALVPSDVWDELQIS